MTKADPKPGEMKLQRVAFKRINPAPYNPRIDLQPGDPRYERIRRSIETFGLVDPLIWNKATGNLVGGHQRFKVLQSMGATSSDVVVVELGEADEKALNVALNKITGDWDDERLATLLIELKASDDIDWTLTGFDTDELDDVLRSVRTAVTGPPAAPPPPDEPVSAGGDLWILGNHRLLCGDAGDPGDVERLVDGARVAMIHTDPPYNVKIESRSNNAIANNSRGLPSPDQARGAMTTTAKQRVKDTPIANDSMSDEEFTECLQAWFASFAAVLAPGGAFYIWGSAYPGSGGSKGCMELYPPVLRDFGLRVSQMIVWNKMHPVLTRKDYMTAFEVCYYGWREGAGHSFYGPANVPDLWDIKKVAPNNMVHLTEKPVELAARAISNSSRVDEHVMDLFGGSGSTLMACEELDRRALLMELDPRYCDVIVNRWEEATRRKAEKDDS